MPCGNVTCGLLEVTVNVTSFTLFGPWFFSVIISRPVSPLSNTPSESQDATSSESCALTNRVGLQSWLCLRAGEKRAQSYGIGPAMTSEDFAQHAWHSDVERLSEESLYQFVEFVWTAVSAVATLTA